MGDFHHRPYAITLEDYRRLEAAGKITRPLTLGTMQRRYASPRAWTWSYRGT